jgi:hypothetical protein
MLDHGIANLVQRCGDDGGRDRVDADPVGLWPGTTPAAV